MDYDCIDLYRLRALVPNYRRRAQKSDLLIAVCCLSAVFMLGLLMSAFNFTEVNARKGFAGFPQRLFTLPVRTCWLVAWPMVCAVVCVVALYVAWAMIIFQPLVEEQLEKAAASGFGGFAAVVRWPAVLLATAVVLYQAIIWCLSGFRITRLLVLGFVLTYVAAIGFLPFLPASVNGTTLRGTWTEGKLTAVLAVTMLGAYATSVVVVGRQRCGGEIGWVWRRVLWQRTRRNAALALEVVVSGSGAGLDGMAAQRVCAANGGATAGAFDFRPGYMAGRLGDRRNRAQHLVVGGIALAAGDSDRARNGQARFLVAGVGAVAVFGGAADYRGSDCSGENESGGP